MFSAIFVLILTFALVEGKSREFVGISVSGETGRVINGKEAETGMFPYAVSLEYKGIFLCTGSLITNSAILTAAHCLIGGTDKPTDYSAIVGTADRTLSANRVNIVKVTPHPDYDDMEAINDIAILHIGMPVVLNSNTRTIPIAKKGTKLQANKTVTAMGWGRTSNQDYGNTTAFPDKLRFTDLMIVSEDACEERWGTKKSHVCAVGENTGMCSGDSGGPLVLRRDGMDIQIGIDSYNGPICGSGSPDVFTRVSEFNDFILENANGEAIIV